MLSSMASSNSLRDEYNMVDYFTPPLPRPPRTPSPPPAAPPDHHDHDHDHDLIPHLYIHAPDLDLDRLSPMSAVFSPPSAMHLAGLASVSPPKGAARAPPSAGLSATSTLSPYSPVFSENSSGHESNNLSDGAMNPFNFQTLQYAPGIPLPAQVKSVSTRSQPNSCTLIPSDQQAQDVGRRRGHKYKHSSVSHQIFLEPSTPRSPLPLPSSLPMPTVSEFHSSFSPEQRLRGLWCCVHLLVAGYVQWSGHDSLAMTALSHLLVFDAIGAFLCVAVDVGGNFEVWKRSSIRYPFGLERAEVLAGLAMSIGLLFMGLDLISHNLQHGLEKKTTTGGGGGGGGAQHAAAHQHQSQHYPYHDRVPAGSVDMAALAAIAATLTSASVLKNHARIGKALRFNLPLPSLLANPTHLLTLSCSALLLLLPLLSLKLYKWLDGLLSVLIAVAMGALGGRLCYALGKMLLMSYAGPDGGAGSVVAEIERDGAVHGVEEARFWQVHHGLCMANLKIRLKAASTAAGLDEEMARVRDRVTSLVRNRLGGGYGGGRGGAKWEVSTQIMLARSAVGHAYGHVHAHGHGTGIDGHHAHGI